VPIEITEKLNGGLRYAPQKQQIMKELFCRCGHKMVRIGEQNATSFGRTTKRIRYSCPYCENEAFLDPKKWNL